jgi:ribosomal protein S18 acetylase RimI-like enzyme
MRDLSLRPAAPQDEALLFQLFCESREEMIAALPLAPEQKLELLRLQFDNRQAQYREQYPDGDFDVVMEDGEVIGNLYALRDSAAYVLIDIALAAEFRNRGIGAQLVSALINEAQGEGAALRAHVEKDNSAWRLWQRLGFRAVGDDGVYLQIEVPAGSCGQD